MKGSGCELQNMLKFSVYGDTSPPLQDRCCKNNSRTNKKQQRLSNSQNLIWFTQGVDIHYRQTWRVSGNTLLHQAIRG